MKSRTILSAVVATVIPTALAGCISSEPVRGWIPAIQPGDTVVDFEIIDQKGQTRAFRDLLGDYTVLVFTRCDRDTHGPATRLLEQIIEENRDAWYVHLVGVDVHWSEAGCPDHSDCHLVSERRHLVSLCDGSGAIRRKYGIGDTNAVYVVGPDDKIVTSAPAGAAAGLRDRLRADVEYLSEQRSEEIEAR